MQLLGNRTRQAAGAKIENQPTSSKPGSPASASVGVSGKPDTRRLPVTASTLTLPCFEKLTRMRSCRPCSRYSRRTRLRFTSQPSRRNITLMRSKPNRGRTLAKSNPMRRIASAASGELSATCRADVADHFEVARHEVEHLGDIFAQLAQRRYAVRASAGLRPMNERFARQVSGQAACGATQRNDAWLGRHLARIVGWGFVSTATSAVCSACRSSSANCSCPSIRPRAQRSGRIASA